MISPRQSTAQEVWVIRVQSANCRYRLELYPSDTYQKVLDMISEKMGCDIRNLEVCNNYGKKLNIPLEKRLKEVVYLSHGSQLLVRQLGDVKNVKNSALQERPNFLSADSRASSKTTISPPKTQCTHPSNVRCLKCLSTPKQTDNYEGNGLLTSNNKDIKQVVAAPCDHGPRMKCLRCMDQPAIVPEKEKKIATVRSLQKINPQQENPVCKHSLRIKCKKCFNSKKSSKIVKLDGNKSPKSSKKPSKLIPNQTKQIQKQKTQEKCQHESSGKCLNCYISDIQKDSLKKAYKCNHGSHAKCMNCINLDEKAAHIAFDQYLFLRSKNCHHPKQNTCPNCLPPKNLRLKLDKNCRLHLPYPQGMCNSCMPQNVSIKRQQYRHVDYVQFMNHNQIQNFVDYWIKEKKKSQLRIGFLYGYYAEDPFYKNGIRAVVEALYQPHQKCTDTLFCNTDTNKRKRDVQQITESLGLEKIGMIIANNNKDAPFTETQIRFMARLQEQLSVTHSSGYRLSNFFTVSIRQNIKDGNNTLQPEIFMVSDQGQALEAAGLLIPNKNNQYKMKLKQQILPNELIPNVFVTGKLLKQFQLQFLLVKIASGTDKSNKFAILKSNEFPTSSRGLVKTHQIKEFMRKNKIKPCSVRFGDLNLLVFVAQVLSIDMARGIASRVGKEDIIEDSFCELVNRQLQKLIS